MSEENKENKEIKENKENKESTFDEKIKALVDKFEFNETYTARQWISQQKAKIRTTIREQLPGIFDSLKDKNNVPIKKGDGLLDLPLGAFMGILRKYNETFNMTAGIEDFLG